MPNARDCAPVIGAISDWSAATASPIVVASLICGDLVAVLASVACTHLLIPAIGLPWRQPQPVSVLLVILAFSVVGLYTGSGPGPYERFRQRTAGIAGFVVIWTFATLPAHDPSGFAVAQVVTAAFLLLVSHYRRPPTSGKQCDVRA